LSALRAGALRYVLKEDLNRVEGNKMLQVTTCPIGLPAPSPIYTITETGFITAKDAEEPYQIYVKQE
jgi:hypothetical protein